MNARPEPIPVPELDQPAHRPPLAGKYVRVEIYKGATSKTTALIVNNRLCSGVLPVGGGRRLHEFQVSRSRLMQALGEEE